MRAMADGVTVERWERLLTLVDILEPLPQEEIKRLAAGRSFISLGAGETLALEENRQSLFLLVSGRVQVYEPNLSGQYITISVIDEGKWSSRKFVRGIRDQFIPQPLDYSDTFSKLDFSHLRVKGIDTLLSLMAQKR
jgi:CRP-like cAMP-binding protein